MNKIAYELGKRLAFEKVAGPVSGAAKLFSPEAARIAGGVTGGGLVGGALSKDGRKTPSFRAGM